MQSAILSFLAAIFFIMLGVKQGYIKYLFWVIGMTQTGIEPRFTKLITWPILIEMILNLISMNKNNCDFYV